MIYNIMDKNKYVQHTCMSEFDCQYLQYVNFSSSDSQITNINFNLNENLITYKTLNCLTCNTIPLLLNSYFQKEDFLSL
jgi:hypothetical protein